jgi:hypothetical protein
MEIDTSDIDKLTHLELVSLFNDFLFELLKQLNGMVKDEDIKYFYNAFEDVIKFNNKLIIDQYIINVLEYYDQIKARDIDFFTKGDQVVNKYKGEESVITKIFKFKELFLKLKKNEQQMLFQSLNVLCYISARYFTLTDK